MSKRRLLMIPMIILLLAFLCGCSGFYDGEYSYVTKHEEPGALIDSTEPYYEVHTYVGMKNAVQSLISSAAESGTIRVKDYSGSVQDDISRACLDATRDYPMGAYAVEYISQSVSRILGYDEVKLRISYRLTAEEMSEVRAAITLGDLYSVLENVIVSGLDHVVVQISSSAVTEQTLNNYLHNFYRSHPERLSSEPQTVITFFPSEDSISKIVEFRFSYREPHEMASAKLEELSSIVDELVLPWESLSDPEKAFYGCLAVAQSIQNVGKGFTAYDALALGSADSEGCAMAYQLLCNRCGVDCRVVEGRMDGSTHYWNIIRLDEKYYHVDAYACIENPITQGFLFSDSQMIQTYWWDVDKYPDCSGSINAQRVIEIILSRQDSAEQGGGEDEDSPENGEKPSDEGSG